MKCIVVSVALTGLAIAGIALVPAAPLAGQQPSLPLVDSLMTAGEYDAARSTLVGWWSGRNEGDVAGSDMARALMLRAQLEPAPRSAESDYLSVVLGYPASPHAAEALLRLGQGLLATGDATRAAAYLDRLATDYPGRLQRPVTLLWLARASIAARRADAACRAAREGLEGTQDPILAGMLRAEAGAACGGTDTSAPPEAPVVAAAEDVVEEVPMEQGPVVEPAPVRPSAAEQQSAAAGEWTVQTGAFRQRATANALMDRLRRAGHSARLVLVPDSDLLRVRVGRYPTSSSASEMVRRLKGAGFDAVVARDASREREP